MTGSRLERPESRLLNGLLWLSASVGVLAAGMHWWAILGLSGLSCGVWLTAAVNYRRPPRPRVLIVARRAEAWPPGIVWGRYIVTGSRRRPDGRWDIVGRKIV